MMTLDDIRICVVGLGYVGLPLARLFATRYPTVGFDTDSRRVAMLNEGHDSTLEVDDELLQSALRDHGMRCTDRLDDVADCNIYVVTVPTPVDANNRPDLQPLLAGIVEVIFVDGAVRFLFTIYIAIHLCAADRATQNAG